VTSLLSRLVTNFNGLSTFYVERDLRAPDLVLGLLWLDDEQASLQFGTTRVFTRMDGTLETQIEERRLGCLLMSSSKIQKLMRKTRPQQRT
jgi:hypothetical protein